MKDLVLHSKLVEAIAAPCSFRLVVLQQFFVHPAGFKRSLVRGSKNERNP